MFNRHANAGFFSPAEIDLGGETPAEIALEIASEIQRVFEKAKRRRETGCCCDAIHQIHFPSECFPVSQFFAAAHQKRAQKAPEPGVRACRFDEESDESTERSGGGTCPPLRVRPATPEIFKPILEAAGTGNLDFSDFEIARKFRPSRVNIFLAEYSFLMLGKRPMLTFGELRKILQWEAANLRGRIRHLRRRYGPLAVPLKPGAPGRPAAPSAG